MIYDHETWVEFVAENKSYIVPIEDAAFALFCKRNADGSDIKESKRFVPIEKITVVTEHPGGGSTSQGNGIATIVTPWHRSDGGMEKRILVFEDHE